MSDYKPRLQEKFKNEVRETLMKEFGYKSIMQVPALDKITISQGLGQAIADKKLIETARSEMELISGQRPVITKSKRDISNFKLRKGMPIGVKVTLRNTRMYEFLDRLISVALPAVRDFDGLNPKGFDGRGNFNMGLTEQIVFPEIEVDKINRISGMDIAFTTTAKTDKEALSLLKQMGIPFKTN